MGTSSFVQAPSEKRTNRMNPAFIAKKEKGKVSKRIFFADDPGHDMIGLES
jgi:hypothetical protein